MEMDDVLEQIRELCAGKSVEEIEQAITESSYADRVTDPGAMARLFFNLSTEPDEEPATGPDDEVPEDT
jgi:hypothetical protein